MVLACGDVVGRSALSVVTVVQDRFARKVFAIPAATSAVSAPLPLLFTRPFFAFHVRLTLQGSRQRDTRPCRGRSGVSPALLRRGRLEARRGKGFSRSSWVCSAAVPVSSAIKTPLGLSFTPPFQVRVASACRTTRRNRSIQRCSHTCMF